VRPRGTALTESKLFDENEVRRLFDEMAETYGVVHLISSFGFCRRWRRQTLEQVILPPGPAVADLMSGMGELWPSIAARTRDARILAIDISPEMVRRAEGNDLGKGAQVEVRVADVLTTEIEPESVDAVVSSFGLKTFSPAQQETLARRIAAMLRPGGSLSLTEISVPPNLALRAVFMAYLTHVVPLIGRCFLGNPENYRKLGRYTRSFGSAKGMAAALRASGLHAELRSYFFGCATGVVGSKPPRSSSTAAEAPGLPSQSRS